MKTVCGANCEDCELYKNNKCKGCNKKCWIASYIEIDKNNFNTFKKELINEFNSLNIDGMPKINELYPLRGCFVNLEYSLPNNKKVKLLNDNESYLGTQVECEFNDKENKKCFGLLANMNFLLVCEYGEGGSDPEIIIYKRRQLIKNKI